MAPLLGAFEYSKHDKISMDEKAALRIGEIRRALLKFLGSAEVQAVDTSLENVSENC
uniref:Uncharacterized protein n=1 Tax=Physcomitrium patens TaxID=3218 RepID=A0A7I3ZP60_PHYPA